jgi:hypothetical protein
VEIIPETGDNLEEFVLSSVHQSQEVLVPPGRYAVIARRPNGERLYRSVTVEHGRPAKVDLAADLPASPNKFMSQETTRGEIAPGPAVKKGQLGLIQGFAGHALKALSMVREATPTSARQSLWTLQAWSVPDQPASSLPAECSFEEGLSFLKVRIERHCLAVGLLDESGFGPIVMTPPFRKPLHITFLAECLAARAAARYLNPSGQRALVALATPEEAPVADLLTALGSIALDHAEALFQQINDALDYVYGKFDTPIEGLLGAHYLLRFLPEQLPLGWADNLPRAFPHAADGPVIAAWLRMTSTANDVVNLDPRDLHADVQWWLGSALDRPITWFARTRLLLVNGLRLEKLKTPRSPAKNSDLSPAAYLDYGAHAGGLEAFWGTHPFSPGTTTRSGAPPSLTVGTIALEGSTFVIPGTASTARRRTKKVTQGSRVRSGLPSIPGGAKKSVSRRARHRLWVAAAINGNLIYFNGIDAETGTYAFVPRSIGELAKQVLLHPDLDAESPRSSGLPFGWTPSTLAEAGWGIVFHEDTSPDVRAALEPLIDHRRQVTDMFKVLDYKRSEQTRDWYRRHQISPGVVDPEIVPYYLLLVGPPDLIPFDFQCNVGVEYAVGRLAFDTAAEYQHYACSIIAYESATALPNAKEIAYWGTRHRGDPATNLSASLLIDPLANGFAGAVGALKRPVHAEVGYDRKLLLGADASKEALLGTLHAAKPPAMLFTASHGMSVRWGRPNQLSDQGALLCQDWPGIGSIRTEHFLAAADITDDANVSGLVAFLFACFSNGTPDADQFLSEAGSAPPLAPHPFIAALPRRLLAHPKGSALAVIGHMGRACSFSIQAPKAPEAQIKTFHDAIGHILEGLPVGHAMCGQFAARSAALTTALASSISPVAPLSMRLSDRDLLTYWLERNDAQSYLMLGDPAVRIRKETLA